MLVRLMRRIGSFCAWIFLCILSCVGMSVGSYHSALTSLFVPICGVVIVWMMSKSCCFVSFASSSPFFGYFRARIHAWCVCMLYWNMFSCSIFGLCEGCSVCNQDTHRQFSPAVVHCGYCSLALCVVHVDFHTLAYPGHSRALTSTTRCTSAAPAAPSPSFLSAHSPPSVPSTDALPIISPYLPPPPPPAVTEPIRRPTELSSSGHWPTPTEPRVVGLREGCSVCDQDTPGQSVSRAMVHCGYCSLALCEEHGDFHTLAYPGHSRALTSTTRCTSAAPAAPSP